MACGGGDRSIAVVIAPAGGAQTIDAMRVLVADGVRTGGIGEDQIPRKEVPEHTLFTY